jgi:hypothetical protein
MLQKTPRLCGACSVAYPQHNLERGRWEARRWNFASVARVLRLSGELFMTSKSLRMDIEVAPDAEALEGVAQCDVAVIGSGSAGMVA